VRQPRHKILVAAAVIMLVASAGGLTSCRQDCPDAADANTRRTLDGSRDLKIGDGDQSTSLEPTTVAASLDVHGSPSSRTETKTGATFALISSGWFEMGCTMIQPECKANAPLHWVKISRDFFIAETETTIGHYREFAEATGAGMPPPAFFHQDDNHPVVNVTWNEASAFCAWIGGRLPSEAEWEYAARGGHRRLRFPWNGDQVAGNANVEGTAGRDLWKATAPVGCFPRNDYGLYDVIGNVSEWVHDAYDPRFYDHSPEIDPRGPAAGESRVLRGGSWMSGDWASVYVRGYWKPTLRGESLGFRCAFVQRQLELRSGDN
jgi:formylglycine-generating enzyme